MEQDAPITIAVVFGDSILRTVVRDRVEQLCGNGCLVQLVDEGSAAEMVIIDSLVEIPQPSNRVSVVVRVVLRRQRTSPKPTQHRELKGIAYGFLYEDEVSTHTLLPWCHLARAKRESAKIRPTANELLAQGAHELRTPLTAILAYVEGLKDPSLDYAAQLKVLGEIRTSGRYLLELIDHILLYSRLEVGQLEISQELIDIHRIFNELQPLLERRAAENGNQFIVEYAYPLPQLFESDALRLRQVLLNLVGNAIKFTENGSVAAVVSYCEDTQRLRIDVIDTGVGIPGDMLAQIFQPFAQGGRDVEKQFGGSGLGLAVTQGILMALGGTIAVSSAVGHGSIFSVSLPATPINGELVVSGVHHTRSMKSGSAIGGDARVRLAGKVLIADDTEATRELLEALFREAGAEVFAVKDGADAVELGNRGDFDLIVMDAEMPRVSGYAAMEQLRAQGIHAPILAVTAHLHREELQKCIAAGATQFVSKASSLEEILFVAEQYIGVVPNNETVLAAEAAPENIESYKVMQRARLKYLTRFERSLVPLKDAVSRKRWNHVKRILHPLSSAKMFGFVHITEELREIARSLQKLFQYEREVTLQLEELELLAGPLNATKVALEASLADIDGVQDSTKEL